jgi:ribosome production factor 1
VLNNFDTRLGHRVGRMFASLFHQDPTFRGRRVVTFHNQRDFIFFRHHRYIFEERQKKEKGKKEKVNVVKARLQVRRTVAVFWWVLALMAIWSVALHHMGAVVVLCSWPLVIHASCFSVCLAQEIGPRFTLKLQSLQKGTFDSRGGEFEWVHKPGEQDTSRRKFQL